MTPLERFDERIEEGIYYLGKCGHRWGVGTFLRLRSGWFWDAVFHDGVMYDCPLWEELYVLEPVSNCIRAVEMEEPIYIETA